MSGHPTRPPRRATGARRRGLVRTLTAVNVLVGLGVLAAGVLAPWPWQARVCVAIVGVGLLGNALLAAREWSGSARWGDRVTTRGSTTVIAYDRVPAYAAAWPCPPHPRDMAPPCQAAPHEPGLPDQARGLSVASDRMSG